MSDMKLMRLKMRNSVIAILLLLVVGYISWQISAVIYHDYVNVPAEIRLVANKSHMEKLKKIVRGKDSSSHCIGGACHMKHKHHGQKGLTLGNNNFYLDGKPFRILGGSFHYFRTQPHQWIDRLERLKAAGLNTVTTYVPWNLHEKIHTKYSFHGRWKLFTFIKLVRKMDLHMIIQPGPYICAELDLGGLPSWLLHDPNMIVRTSKYRPYLEQVELYFRQLLPQLAKYTYRNGGPIIAFQIENEFGNYGPDEDYLKFLVGLYEASGIRELLFTSDIALSPERIEKGSLSGFLATVKFNSYPLQSLQRLKKFQPNKPLMVMEFGYGRLKTWGRSNNTNAAAKFVKTVDAILSMNASINFYMFVGGTNFGFWNGASLVKKPNEKHGEYLPVITSYDYDASVSESGDCHPEKYEALRGLLLKHKLISQTLPPIPKNPPKMAYGSVTVSQVLRIDDFIKVMPKKVPVVTLPLPVFMEYLNISHYGGQACGWILYRTSFDFGNSVNFEGIVQDRAQIFINSKLVKIIYNTQMTNISQNIIVELKSMKNKDNILEILVENMGRVSDWRLANQRRGFQGKVTVNEKVLSTWEHISLDFSAEFMTAIGKSQFWKPYIAQHYPSLYRGYLHIQTLRDTFLYTGNWGKGIALINGYNVGRYWSIGPQQTLYIPKPLLRKGRNEIIMFELDNPANKLEFVAEAVPSNATLKSINSTTSKLSHKSSSL